MAKKKARSGRKIEPTPKDIEQLQLEKRILKDISVTFRIEKELKDDLKRYNINISKACREYLRKLVEVASK